MMQSNKMINVGTVRRFMSQNRRDKLDEIPYLGVCGQEIFFLSLWNVLLYAGERKLLFIMLTIEKKKEK